MSPISFITGIFTAFFATTSLAAPQLGEIQTFKDWTVGCDNLGDCEAISLVPDEGRASFEEWDGRVSIIRTTGSDDIFKIRILFEAEDIDRYRMIIDGQLVDTGPIGQSDYPVEIVGTDATKVAKAMIHGNLLTMQGPAGTDITKISLAGSSAALRYIDQVQNRAHTTSALVARGSRIFQPVNSDMPRITVDRWEEATLVPETDTIVALAENSKCKDDRFGLIEDQAYPIGKRDDLYRALVLISCGSGAYNFSSTPYIGEYREDSAEGWTFAPAKFDRQPSWGGEGNQPLLINAGWDEEEQTLGSYGKGRGLGDCGNAENYIWDGDMFRMINASAMPECRGAYEWITIWRAEYRKLEQAAKPEE
ncbi:DUF1176 domain-containing protein [Parasphingorhabdus sp.]|uniref:DUF1176 domain-containing protein n=1 Tax=Parasphingorhabdus sp. TaxID=2709688 RepID=UPI003264A62D